MAEPAPIALVTGAAGFVGSHLVEALVAEGRRVRCLVRPSSRLQWLEGRAGVEIIREGLRDPDAVARAVTGVGEIYHLAAITSAARESEYFETNVEGTRRLLDATVASAPDAAFVFCSTRAAAGPSKPGSPLVEGDAPPPISPYGLSKLRAEEAVSEYRIRGAILRPGVVYGPRDRDVYEMFRWAARGIAPVVGGNEQELSLIYVDDLVAALRAAAGRAAANAAGQGAPLYYVTDGAIHLRSDVVRGIAGAVGRTVRRVRFPVALAGLLGHGSRVTARFTGLKPLLTPERIRDMTAPAWTCDDSRARRELGYSSSVTLTDGLNRTAVWYRKHGWI